MECQIRKIYIDTRYKRDKYGSNTNFEIDLPQTVECPPNTVCYVDEIVLPNTITTIQTGVNDRLYFAVFYNGLVRYRSLVIPEQNYTLQGFSNELKTLMNNQLQTTEAEINLTYNIDKLTMTFTLIDKRTVKPGVMRWDVFSDDNIKAGLYNFLTIPNPLTCNDILQNYVVDPNATWTANNVAVNYSVDLHTTKNIYVLGSIGEFRTITNFEWSGSTVLKKIQVTAGYNETLFSNIVMPYDSTHVGNESFNRIKFRLVNSKGQEPNLKSNWSFSLIFSNLN